ncbi:hypothetical protein N7539_001853 [Penicillium diatomitis]|uniref:Mitogen-activated protein kinase kinae kinase bck1 n=1 Tax=Penicillium diatomitis TaxID=2819901 RepID=A0A9W9XHH1_9EURO|nr:uncharacterized protein N7539_001853 [Penicillium diatomitis]KAJ5493107.1 hypothetical protein N7539_001853 [Penicillium diatomitis]
MRSVTLPIPSGFDGPAHESPSRDSPSWLRSDYSRNALAAVNDHRRQSPSVSSESGALPASLRAQDSPKSGSPAAHYVSPSYSGLTSSSTGDLPLRYEHSRVNSTESTPGAARGSASTGRYYESRRQGTDVSRPSNQAQEPSKAHGPELSSSIPREHSKSILNLFSRKKGHKTDVPSHPSSEDLESPPSPEARTNGYLPYQPAFNSSDMSLGERSSSVIPTKTKKWMFGTMDGVNYRLIDITDWDSVETLRAGICHALGISDWSGAQIFLTQPGQTEHEDPMSDSILAVSRRTKSDAYGSLKVFVKGVLNSHSANQTPRFDGLGVSIPSEKPALSPTAAHGSIHRKPLEEAALNRISPKTQGKPYSDLLGSRQNTLKATPAKSLPDGSPDPGLIQDPDKMDLLARHEAHMREVERKQKENRISRLPPPTSQQTRKDTYGDTGYRREGVIDFDSPRLSPYEEKKVEKSETLVPLRKPPVAPNESNTLTKVNSLRKVPGERGERHRQQTQATGQSHGLGAVLATVGRISGAIDSGSNVTAFGGEYSLDTVPPFASRSTPNETSPQNTTSEKPTAQSRKSFGPEFDFEESEGGAPKPAPELEKRRKPSLSLDTDNAKPRRVVSFISPNTSSGKGFATPVSGERKGGEFSAQPRKFSGTFYGSDSSDDDEPNRRDSFVNGDVWASRPAVEGVIDNLDSFFPNVDLDAPYLEEPPSPNAAKGDPDASATIRARQDPSLPMSQSATDMNNMSSDASTMRPPPGSQGGSIVARRNLDRSGGLSRKKSIREVARGAAHRTKSVSSAGPQQSGNLLRRKSTKMFGAKIMQISPKPGKRLRQLDPIPQNAPTSPETSGTVPQRQPTFRIIRGQLIGKGTYGRVYLGMNADNGEVLAVKQVEINARLAGTDRDRIKEMVAALDQEIDTMQHLEHPNIVQYLGCERGETSISIYLEYISGGSVGSCLRKHGKFEESVVKSLTRQTLDGLAYLHDMGILHRDLKADNILLDLDGTCKISDFGISKKTDDIYGNDSSNSMQGSVFWMAPEVIQSQGQGYSAKVDIWSLGCVVLEMFAGRRPWSKEEAIGAIFKLGSLNQAPPIPDDVSMSISPAALAFMYDCFTVNSSERPTAGTLLTRHPFCEPDPSYNFLDTELYAKIRHVL